MSLFRRVGFRAAVFVDEFGDEKDVVGAGKDGEGEDGAVESREIVAGAVRDAGREHDGCNSEDLDGGVDFAQHRGAEAAEAGDDVDCRCADDDEDVAADHSNSYPKRDWKMGG